MEERFRVAVVQKKSTDKSVEQNATDVISQMEEAKTLGADLVLFRKLFCPVIHFLFQRTGF